MANKKESKTLSFSIPNRRRQISPRQLIHHIHILHLSPHSNYQALRGKGTWRNLLRHSQHIHLR